jgi:hypothetical protein
MERPYKSTMGVTVMIDGQGAITGLTPAQNTGRIAGPLPQAENGAVITTADVFARAQTTGAGETYNPQLVPRQTVTATAEATSTPQPQNKGGAPAGWATAQASHGGAAVELRMPPGWNITSINDSIFVSSPVDKKATVGFMWPTGMGPMDPQSLINDAASLFNMQNYTPTHSTPVQSMPSGMSTYSGMEQDATYTLKGEKCKSHAQSLVVTSNNPYVPHWSGALVWSQAPEAKWDDYRDTLALIGSSMKPASGKA